MLDKAGKDTWGNDWWTRNGFYRLDGRELHQRQFPELLVQWLIVCVNLTGLRDAQRASKFSGVSLRVFPEEISIWTGKLSKEHPSPSEWVSSSTESLTRTKKWKKVEFALLLELGHTSSSVLGHQCFRFSGLQTQTERHDQLSWFSSLQMAHYETSWPPWPCEPIPIISILTYIFI